MSQCKHWRIPLFLFRIPRRRKRNAGESCTLRSKGFPLRGSCCAATDEVEMQNAFANILIHLIRPSLRTGAPSPQGEGFFAAHPKSSRCGAISAAAFLLFRLFPAPLSRTNRSHRGVLFNLRGIVLTERKSFNLRFNIAFLI